MGAHQVGLLVLLALQQHALHLGSDHYVQHSSLLHVMADSLHWQVRAACACSDTAVLMKLGSISQRQSSHGCLHAFPFSLSTTGMAPSADQLNHMHVGGT